jgi:hypothetical protein
MGDEVDVSDGLVRDEALIVVIGEELGHIGP